MNEKRQPSNRQLKVGQQIRFLVSNFFIKEDFVFENFDSKNLTVVDVVLSPDLKNAKIFVITNSFDTNKLLINELNNTEIIISGGVKFNWLAPLEERLFLVNAYIEENFEKIETIEDWTLLKRKNN